MSGLVSMRFCLNVSQELFTFEDVPKDVQYQVALYKTKAVNSICKVKPVEGIATDDKGTIVNECFLGQI